MQKSLKSRISGALNCSLNAGQAFKIDEGIVICETPKTAIGKAFCITIITLHIAEVLSDTPLPDDIYLPSGRTAD